MAASSLLVGGGGGEEGMWKLGSVGMVSSRSRWRSEVYGERGAEAGVAVGEGELVSNAVGPGGGAGIESALGCACASSCALSVSFLDRGA